MKKIILFIAAVVLGLFIVILALDIAFGPTEPKLGQAPAVFCNKTRFTGFTAAPFGIYACPEQVGNEELIAHELVHWDQYKRYGLFGFLARYVTGMITTGFSYEDYPMEIEARNRTDEFIEAAKNTFPEFVSKDKN